jgi:hypothetical protein
VIYGAFLDRSVARGGKEVLRRWVEHYVAASMDDVEQR